MWLKVTTGRAESLPNLKRARSTRARRRRSRSATRRSRSSPRSLVARLETDAAVGQRVRAGRDGVCDRDALAENAVEKFGNLSSEFPRQVEAMLSRLDAAQASRPIPAATAPILDEMFRRAHERCC
jgi:hypothetical protein